MLKHHPVLLNEVLNCLRPGDKKIYVDATFGTGGYTKAILKKADCKVIAIDQDIKSKKYVDEINVFWPGKVDFYHNNFKNIDSIVRQKVDAIVADCGISTTQLLDVNRGFSFQYDAPLDMRIDRDNNIKQAKHIVNFFNEEKLADLIYQYSQERYSRRIAKFIVKERKIKNIITTQHLAKIVHTAIGLKKIGKINSATKTFQALRIAVNSELECLSEMLMKSINLLKSGGKLIVVTFHSLEDKIVKDFFKNHSYKRVAMSKYSNDQKKSSVYNKVNTLNKKNIAFDIIEKKPIVPSDQEIKLNPNSRSSKLRFGIKIEN